METNVSTVRLQTGKKTKGSGKARKAAVMQDQIFMSKEDMRVEFKKVWGNDQKMVEWCIKNHSGIKLSDGKVIMFDKPNIDTNFCFGYSTCGQGPEYDECMNTYNDYQNHKAEWFILSNLQQYDRMYRLPEIEEDLVLSRSCGDIWNFYWVSEYRMPSFLDRNFRMEFVVSKNENDIDLIKRAISAHKQQFVKRLESYVKRYGTSKLRSWTYWMDE